MRRKEMLSEKMERKGAPRSTMTDERIKSAVGMMNETIDILNGVLDGKTIMASASEHGLGYKEIERIVVETERWIGRKNTKVTKMYACSELITPIERLYADIWGINIFTARDAAELCGIIPDDAEETVDYVERTMLDERQRKAIQMIYFEDKTLADVGEELNLTRERVRQIVCKAMRKFRYPSTRQLMQHGIAFKKELDERFEKAKAEEMDRLLDERLKWDAELKKQRAELEKRENSEKEFNPKAVSIEDSCFSIRIKNVMYRHNIYDTDGLNGIAVYELLKFRNLGKKCIDEILAKQEMYGYKVVG